VSTDQDRAATRAATAYDAASDHYLDDELSFWDHFGEATIARLPLVHGARVLDLCCGAGASALPAARRVGPRGRVVGVDVSERLLNLARARAQREGLTQVQWRCGDATALGEPDHAFDAVVCVFGVFFAADRAQFVREMWRLVRPGGYLAITTWGEHLFEPANTLFWDAVARRRPELRKSFNPWDDIVTVDALRHLFSAAGTSEPEITLVERQQPLRGDDPFWSIALGSGYRATLELLTPDERAQVRADVAAAVRASAVTSVTTNALVASARRAG
jgi:ubiquinone/menaquinone biosynthesis C-methylase UbiE